MIEMMYKSNFIAMVFDDEKDNVIIWDDDKQCIRTQVSFHSEIKNIKLSKKHLVVVTEEKVFVFNFKNLKGIDQIETLENPQGIVALAQGEKPINRVVVCPHSFKGMLKVHIFIMDKSKESIVTAHESEIGALTVNPEGTLIASASTKGTIIRIISVEGGEQLQELRRGTGKAVINELVFHPSLNLLAGGSDRRSVHVFVIKSEAGKVSKVEADNRKSGLKFLSIFSKFFNSDWSVSKIKIPEADKIGGFDTKNHTLTIITKDRLLYFVTLPKKASRYLEKAKILTY